MFIFFVALSLMSSIGKQLIRINNRYHGGRYMHYVRYYGLSFMITDGVVFRYAMMDILNTINHGGFIGNKWVALNTSKYNKQTFNILSIKPITQIKDCHNETTTHNFYEIIYYDTYTKKQFRELFNMWTRAEYKSLLTQLMSIYINRIEQNVPSVDEELKELQEMEILQ